MTRREIKAAAKELEKKLIMEELEKQKFLSSKTDFSFLEAMIKKCNENQNLRIEIFLNDGTKIFMKTWDGIHTRVDPINGRFIDEVVERYG